MHNRFAELDEGVQAEEVARKADADKEDRSKDSWDPNKRNLDIAKRKQLWKQACRSKEQAQLDEGVQAEEAARKTDADKEERSKHSWDPEKRNLDIAKRKQLWKQECRSKEQAQRLEEAQSDVPAEKTGGNLGRPERGR